MTPPPLENMDWLKKVAPVHSGISSRLIVGMVLISCLAVIGMITLHTYIEYNTQLREIDTEFDHVAETILPGLINNLWIYDLGQVQLLLDAASHHAHTKYLELRSPEQEILFKSGSLALSHAISREYDLTHDHDNQPVSIGTLIIKARRVGIHELLWTNIKTALIENGIIIFLLAMVVLYLFNQLVTRHLIHMAAYARKLDIDKLEDAEPLKLKRHALAGGQDELDELTAAFNQMMHSLAASTEKLKQTNRQLQEEINQRRKSEKEKEKLAVHLRQAHKMEAIGTMAGGIAHDFNNILAIILGNADLAMMNLPAGNQARKSMEQILKATNRAKDLVRQILAFSRRDTASLKPFYLCRLIEENIHIFRATIPSTVEIKINIPAICRDNITQCGKVLVDPTQIHQLLMNLCSNAVDAMDEKGVLEIGVGEKIIGHEIAADRPGLQPGTYEYLFVSDSGPGMSPEVVEQIFDPFFTTKEVGKGTGMGLSVVHGIIESHGGMVFVDSEPGKGTVFHLYFPVVAIEPETEILEISALPTGSEQILFVDDEQMIRDIWSATFTLQGYETTPCSDGTEALETFRSAPDRFDLVITDQTMPNMSGVELANELLKIRPDIPIILCTGYSTKVSEEIIKEIGIREFCMKPLDKRQMATTMRRVLDAQ